jgi:hypothetical protein
MEPKKPTTSPTIGELRICPWLLAIEKIASKPDRREIKKLFT